MKYRFSILLRSATLVSIFAALLASTLSGCREGELSGSDLFGGGNNGGGGGGVTYNYFLYGLNSSTTQSLMAYSINKSTGALTQVSGSPYDACGGATPGFSAIAVTTKFVYVGCVSGNIKGFSINSSTGSLTALGTVATVGGGVYHLTATANGSYLYGGYGTSNIFRYAINSTTGLLTAAGTNSMAGCASLDGVKADPSGNFVIYTCFQASNLRLRKYSPDLSTQQDSFNARSSCQGQFAVQISSNSTNVYAVCNDPSWGLQHCTISGLTFSATNPYAIVSPIAQAIDPQDRFVFVANSGNILTFPLDISGVPGSSTSTATSVATPYGLAVDPGGKFLYSANNGNTTLAIYSINQSTGALTYSSSATMPATGNYLTSIAVPQ